MAKGKDDFDRVADIGRRDYEGKFVIFDRHDQKDRICDIYDRDDHAQSNLYQLTFSQELFYDLKKLEINNLAGTDETSLNIFTTRVSSFWRS